VGCFFGNADSFAGHAEVWDSSCLVDFNDDRLASPFRPDVCNFCRVVLSQTQKRMTLHFYTCLVIFTLAGFF